MLRLWGKEKEIKDRQRHRLVKHLVGKDQKPTWVKIPNIPVVQNKIIARKLLQLNYQFHTGRNSKPYTKDYKTWSTEWRERVAQIKNTPKLKYNCKRPLRKKRDYEDIKPLGRGRGRVIESDEEDAAVINKNVDLESNEAISRTSVNESSILGNEIAKYPLDSECDTNNIPAQSKEPETPIEDQTEEQQQYTWGPQMMKDYNCHEVNEIISNMRVVALTPLEYEICPKLETIFCETIRSGIYKHDWILVLKAVQGLCLEANRGRKYWVLWNGGFLAIANLFKDDLEKIKQFGLDVKEIMLCYPRRLGIEVAIWLIQKGYFDDGREILRTWIETKNRSFYWGLSRVAENPKRKLIDLVGNLIEAVYIYAKWTSERHIFESRSFEGSSYEIETLGVKALQQFEQLLILSQESQSDVTIFIEPLIELTLVQKDKYQAKEIYEKVLYHHPRNGIIENLYIQFLENHFSEESANEILELKKMNSLRYGHRNEEDTQERTQNSLDSQNKLSTWYKKVLTTDSGDKKPFKLLSKPKFSW